MTRTIVSLQVVVRPGFMLSSRWFPQGSAALVEPLRCRTRRDWMGLDGPLSGGEWVGLVLGETTVRDMMEVGKELEHDWGHQNGMKGLVLTTTPGPRSTRLSKRSVPYGAR